MAGALTAKGCPPQVAGKPGELAAGLAGGQAAGGKPKAAYLKEYSGRIEKGMGVGTIDRDSFVIAGHPMAAESAEDSRRPPFFLVQCRILSRPIPLGLPQ